MYGPQSVDKATNDRSRSGRHDQQLPMHVVYGPPAPRPSIANPAPLGLLAFGMTTVFLMFAETGWAGAGPWVTAVMGYAVFYGGLAQFVAGIFEMVKGNTFAATAFISYGAFWMGWALKTWYVRGNLVNDPFNSVDKVGETLYAVFWGIFTTIFFIATLRKNLCLMTVFGTLAITFFLLAGGQWSPKCGKAAGYVGFICGLSAIYAAAAEIWQEALDVAMPGLGPVRFI